MADKTNSVFSAQQEAEIKEIVKEEIDSLFSRLNKRREEIENAFNAGAKYASFNGRPGSADPPNKEEYLKQFS
jgi:hypothetical protein